ncbi:venom carboxylesterase-6-like isoform X1 [Homalodisca vitripennis]|uniref:venom carboxylesterase-6-like isoform X1 n=2 Tax=Homalodisca vitripennis TaxID=197043 RepID=UPI001EEBC873|nr:venom carboxylesterase-6-like isoform X1 [Homalodisca vitripennis]
MIEETPMIRTIHGQLQGKYMSSRSGRKFMAFLGIPYAAPPVGKFRFLPPQPAQQWEGVRRATEEGNICSQGKYGGCEDCLFVNVFTHNCDSEALKPVMFYIHGGSFYMGAPSMGITGPEYLMDRDIVLVTVRYRLGPFGFLSTEDSVVPGNMGLKDQVKALEWVQENIVSFGGDPKKVTLFGCSAGASAVHLHMQSPASRDLFVRGISQSGTSLGTHSLMGKGTAREYTVKLAKLLDCSSLDSQEILQCLQQKTTSEIEKAHQNLQFPRYGMTKSIFRPVVEVSSDQAFITSSPLLATTEKPWLVGLTANEGILDIREKVLNHIITKIRSDYKDYIPKALLFEDICSEPSQIAESIYDFYFKNSMNRNDMIKSIEEMYTDWWFLWPTEQAIRKHKGPLFYYLYAHQGQHSYAEVYNSPTGLGVSHLDDLLSLFRHSLYFPELNERDTNVSKLLVNLWVDFAMGGNPTPHPISNNPQTNQVKDFLWTVHHKSDPKHLHIQTQKLSMERGIYSNRLEFWDGLHVVDKLP